MLLKIGVCIAFLIATVIEFFLIVQLAVGTEGVLTGYSWLVWHLLASLVGSVALAMGMHWILGNDIRHNFVLSLSFVFCLPFVGIMGFGIAFVYGANQSINKHTEEVYWQFTNNAELPFTTPLKREIKQADSRGFSEQFAYSTDADSVYKKVLAAATIRTSLSVDALKTAIKHSDERVRLTAYQTLDKKTNHLNHEIQRLETIARAREGMEKANTWLQIASNYWELLEIESDEPVARKQLLEKASRAAMKAIAITPENRNAHFILGRISLLQNDYMMASKAFEESVRHGIPEDKAMPYLAEAAFALRDFTKVRQVLDSIDTAFKKYPPLKNVAEYWA